MNFTQLCGGVHEDNQKSIHVLQRAGYKKTNYYIKDNHQNIMFIREKPRLFHF